MYNYLSKEALLRGETVVVLQSESRIDNYKQIVNQGELVECAGDIPANWEYNAVEDKLYDIKEKPSPYHVLRNGEWEIGDIEGFKVYRTQVIDRLKEKVLAYGFDYQGHRQRCRDKDVAFMVATITALQAAATLGKKKKITWYFEDNAGAEMGLNDMAGLMLLGTTFVQSVYDTENYFKVEEMTSVPSQEAFEEKRKEIHDKLVSE